MSKNDNYQKLAESIERVIIELGKASWILCHIAFHGARRIDFRSIEFKVYAPSFLGFVFGITYKHYYIFVAHKIAPHIFTEGLCVLLITPSWLHHYVLVAIFSGFVILILLGLGPYYQKKKLQKQLDEVHIKSGHGTAPQVVAIERLDYFKTKLTLLSKGVGLETYTQKQNQLASSFNSIIESIHLGSSPQFVEILLTTKILPQKVEWAPLIGHLKKPYSLVIGESLGGIITVDISTLPHMLIAGSTGGGKSVFFKQALLGLLHSSDYIQMYLLDLKGGVEMKEFGDLPNVRVVKSESEAVSILKKVRDEMKRRFAILEEKGHKSIVSQRDKLDKIIIGIDEASELYTKVSVQNSKQKLILQARELTDELAKLARAAGIHLIFATQKINKDTMDPKVQENIGGRLCFRVNTLENSMRAIGNNMAFRLPDIKGRGIWATGNQFIEIQSPLISDEDLKEKISFLKEKYEGQENLNFQPMIEVNEDKGQVSDDLSQSLTGRPL